MALDDHALGGVGADTFVVGSNASVGDFDFEEDSLVIDLSGELRLMGATPNVSELRPLFVTTDTNISAPPTGDAIYAVWNDSDSALNIFDSENTPLVTVELPGLIGIGFDTDTPQGLYWLGLT
jgi:hypothetical protein